MSKKTYFFIVVLLSFFLTKNVYPQDKIAFIDINYLFANSNIGKKINKEVSSKRNSLNKEFEEFKKKIDNEKKSLLKQKNVLAEDEYKKKYAKLEKNINEYNQIIAKKNKDLIDYQNKSKNEFTIKLGSTLESYSKENSISMIFRKENLLIGKNNLDITKEILELFNK